MKKVSGLPVAHLRTDDYRVTSVVKSITSFSLAFSHVKTQVDNQMTSH